MLGAVVHTETVSSSQMKKNDASLWKHNDGVAFGEIAPADRILP